MKTKEVLTKTKSYIYYWDLKNHFYKKRIKKNSLGKREQIKAIEIIRVLKKNL